MAFTTSHVEIAEKDIIVNGRAIGKGQAYIVSDLEFAGGGGAGGVDYVKIASFIGQEMQCFKMNEIFVTVTGSDLVTTLGSTTVTSAGTDWVAQGIKEGTYIRLTSGSDAGPYRIATVAPGEDATALELECAMATTATGISFEVIKETKWEPDYATVIRSYPEPESPLRRYRPYLGSGDHVGCDLTTAVGSALVFVPGAKFNDVDNPVPVGAYLEIYQGADQGRYRIIGGITSTNLLLDTSLTADSPPGGLAYRINLVSEHASVLSMVAFDGKNVLTGTQDGIEVKIARPIRNEGDAIAFDIFREMGTDDTVDLFDKIGSFLACYRLTNAASQAQGVPVDNRVVIAALPWRGHLVDGVLYFDDQNPPQPKYDLSSADEPVWPIRWLRDNWRLEDAIAEDELQEPTAAQVCP